jgi:hypothetical protein
MTLAEEAQLYLAVVEAFRAEGCEPHWQPESGRPARTAESQTDVARTTFFERMEGSHE